MCDIQSFPNYQHIPSHNRSDGGPTTRSIEHKLFRYTRDYEGLSGSRRSRRPELVRSLRFNMTSTTIK